MGCCRRCLTQKHKLKDSFIWRCRSMLIVTVSLCHCGDLAQHCDIGSNTNWSGSPKAFFLQVFTVVIMNLLLYNHVLLLLLDARSTSAYIFLNRTDPAARARRGSSSSGNLGSSTSVCNMVQGYQIEMETARNDGYSARRPRWKPSGDRVRCRPKSGAGGEEEQN